jgi:hypothetical protein
MDVVTAVRAARNQATYREVNERVASLNAAFTALLPFGEWICECFEDSCTERIELTSDEYEAVRASPTRFLVAPGERHVLPRIEDVIERNDRYWVVEKIGEAAAHVTGVDPRRPRT